MNPNFHKTQIRQIDAKKLGILLLPCSNSNILLSEATIFDEMVEEEEEREQSWEDGKKRVVFLFLKSFRLLKGWEGIIGGNIKKKEKNC